MAALPSLTCACATAGANPSSARMRSPGWTAPTLTVLTHALVTRLTFEGKTATGVELVHQGKTRRIGASLEVVDSLGAILFFSRFFSGLCFGHRFFQGFKTPLQACNLALNESNVEEGHVLRWRIQRVAIAQPRRIIDSDFFEAQLLQYRRRLRCTNPALAVDDGLLVGIKLGIERLKLFAGFEIQAIKVAHVLLFDLAARVRIDPIFHIMNWYCARYMAAANGPDFFAAVLLLCPRIQNLNLGIVKPSHDFGRVDQ